jgi:hypothetical protein
VTSERARSGWTTSAAAAHCARCSMGPSGSSAMGRKTFQVFWSQIPNLMRLPFRHTSKRWSSWWESNPQSSVQRLPEHGDRTPSKDESCSIARRNAVPAIESLERRAGIAPASREWKSRVLLLDDRRVGAQGESRTHTSSLGQQGLSLRRLPFRHLSKFRRFEEDGGLEPQTR